MEWRQFVEPSITVLRGLRCAISSILADDNSRVQRELLLTCYGKLVKSQHGYHSGAKVQAIDRIKSFLPICVDRTPCLVYVFIHALDELVDYVISQDGRLRDPYIYWRVSLLVNPYILWSYYIARGGVSYIPDGTIDFLVPLRRSIDFIGESIPQDRHVHFESSLYPDDLLSMLMLKEGFPYYMRAKSRLKKGGHPPREHLHKYRLRSLAQEWDYFPHYTLTFRGKELWQSMIVSLWEFFINLSRDLIVEENNFRYDLWQRRSIMLLEGGYTNIPLSCKYDFPKLSRCLFDIVYRCYKKHENCQEAKFALLALIASNLIWASFGDTKVEGLKDFASGIYSHPLKEIAKGIRKEYVKAHIGSKYIGDGSSILEPYVRSIRRRIGGSGRTLSDTELRLSLVDDTFKSTKIDNTIFPIYKGLKDKHSSNFTLDVVLHYIKIGSEREKYRVIRDLFGFIGGNSIIEQWVRETEQTFFYLFFKRNSVEKINLIAGFDAASDEMWTPVWLLAPFFRFWYIGVGAYSDRLNLSFRKMTFHAGEDFLDIVSGVRRMFDVSFMISDFGIGRDRIGHGIAFGVDPFHMGIGTATISWFDYFMNVWFLSYLYEKYLIPSDFPIDLKGYVRKAMKEIVEKIFCEDKSEDANIVRDVRKLPLEDWMMMYEYLFKIGAICISYYFNNNLIRRLWNLYTGVGELRENTYANNTCKVMAYLGKKLVKETNDYREKSIRKVVVAPIFPTHIMAPHRQKELVDMLSVLITNNMKRNDISPEVCVTSNMLIRDIKDPFVHPWASHYDGDIRYVVGTDNPLFTLSIPELEEYLIKRGGKYGSGN